MQFHSVHRLVASLVAAGVLIACQADPPATDAPRFSYPEALIEAAGILPADIARHHGEFKNHPVHLEWMRHVNAALPDMDDQTLTVIDRIHTAFLYIKARLDQTYQNKSITRATFDDRTGQLMSWFQSVHSSVLSEAQSASLFGATADTNEDPVAVDSEDGPLGFPVENPGSTVEMIMEKLDARTVEAIRNRYRERKMGLEDVRRAHQEGSLSLPDYERMKHEIQAAYIDDCRDILTDEQFALLFGSGRS